MNQASLCWVQALWACGVAMGRWLTLFGLRFLLCEMRERDMQSRALNRKLWDPALLGRVCR